MPERAIWRRFLRKHCFTVIMFAWLICGVVYVVVPSWFPAWARPIFILFEGMD